MSDANHLRLRARWRIVAAGIGIWFVACTLLAARHDAQAVHWVDRAGRAFHAIHAAPTVAADHAVLHARGERPDLDACELAIACHAATSAATAPPRLGLVPRAECSIGRAGSARAAIARLVYRLAPKTSPPRAG